MGLSRERPSVPNVANKFLVLVLFFILIKTMLCFLHLVFFFLHHLNNLGVY